ncbi:hypothetical protein BpHYR1_030741 [Brachionus plicatilis]|uniref:Uncharacterized protein n=1 Tax=Brachionus plicatilis TaxID=10195 RepID=A0A3M7PSD7_BRAPC|nr:hypothetical protein BpHYR1_030741 [Brachionus plicatilis]
MGLKFSTSYAETVKLQEIFYEVLSLSLGQLPKLQAQGLTTLRDRRERGDSIQFFKLESCIKQLLQIGTFHGTPRFLMLKQYAQLNNCNLQLNLLKNK